MFKGRVRYVDFLRQAMIKRYSSFTLLFSPSSFARVDHTFSAFWLWSSVVSVLISVTTDMLLTGSFSCHINFSWGAVFNGLARDLLTCRLCIALPRSVANPSGVTIDQTFNICQRGIMKSLMTSCVIHVSGAHADLRAHVWCDHMSIEILLGTARKRRFPLPEILLWTTASLHPSESQTSECSDLLSRSRATFVIVAQRQPGKLHNRRRHDMYKYNPCGVVVFSLILSICWLHG